MKSLTKTALTSFVAVTCLAAARVALATYTAEQSGLTEAASALYGENSGVSTDLLSIVGGAINAVLSLVGTFFLILIIYSGSLWMTSRGNQEQIKRAQNTMTSAVIGIIIVMGSYTITGFVIDQILGATGYGSDVDLVTETQDAVDKPPIDLSGCDQDAFNACLAREDMQEFEQATRDQICQIECGSAGSSVPDECDLEGFQGCMVTTDGDDTSCSVLYKCFSEGVDATADDEEEEFEDTETCWATPPCNTSTYDDPACTLLCGGSRPVTLTGESMDGGNCIDECINVHKHSISACEASCSSTQYNSCIDDCVSGGGNSTDCGIACADQAPDPDPTGLAGTFDDCVAQCTNDEDSSLSQTQCEQQCTGVDAGDPLVSTHCYADCFASDPSVLGEDLGYDATTFYCNKTCLNPDVISAEVNEACWNFNSSMDQLNRLQACMIDNVCWDMCLNNGYSSAKCLDDCRLVHYD